VLSSSAQILAGWLDVPVFGLAPRPYSARDWTVEEARALIDERGVGYVIVHSADSEGGSGAGREFFRSLRAGQVPEWLHVVERSQDFTVYAVAGARQAGASSEPVTPGTATGRSGD
jgi:hypothetical protein